MAKEKTTKTATTDTSNDLYFVDELVAASKQVFNLQTECVATALRNVEGKITLDKAKKLVNDFMNKEVK